MTDKTVVPYDATRLMDAVRDRIKAEFVGLIPEDTWKQMVKTEVDRFFKEPDAFNYGYGRERTVLPSQFQSVVWKALEEDTKAKVKAYLDSPEWQVEWNAEGTRKASDAVRRLITEKSGEIISNVLGGAIQSVIESMRRGM